MSHSARSSTNRRVKRAVFVVPSQSARMPSSIQSSLYEVFMSLLVFDV
ncbi:MAG: hypothetical protein HUU45_13995 [Leptospiraceae bacterium]|nr:hypothetical protein [Leptospiraceae bacterium]